jgi:hypothetical protein
MAVTDLLTVGAVLFAILLGVGIFVVALAFAIEAIERLTAHKLKGPTVLTLGVIGALLEMGFVVLAYVTAPWWAATVVVIVSFWFALWFLGQFP